MKTESKKAEVICAPVKTEQADKKQTSGDKQFDDAIDKMLKKPVYQPTNK